jgi:isopentenyl-diphosphate delta-isomerase
MGSKKNIVSFDDEKLVLVDEHDNLLGYENKDKCHDGEGILHRAFSIFIFNSSNELLLQQRDRSKRLWGGYWSNTCCSHPRKGEDLETATARRLQEELGLKAELKFLFKFEYHASFGEAGSEHELCYVYTGCSDDVPEVNYTEVSDWKYMPIDALTSDIEIHSKKYTPWFKLEWQRLMDEFLDEIKKAAQ